MKRALILPLVGAALALSVFAAGAAAFGTGDSKGPACRDITGGNFAYDLANSFGGSISVNAPACKNVTYSVANGGIGYGKIGPAGAKYAKTIAAIQAKIKSGAIKNIPDTVK